VTPFLDAMPTDEPKQILLSPPHLSGAERHFVEEAFRTNWIAPLGPNVDAFEREMAARLSSDGAEMHCCATSSGAAPAPASATARLAAPPTSPAARTDAGGC
jgi:dTDP-4-amino-4,6-dideoxygalactose transaminase